MWGVLRRNISERFDARDEAVTDLFIRTQKHAYQTTQTQQKSNNPSNMYTIIIDNPDVIEQLLADTPAPVAHPDPVPQPVADNSAPGPFCPLLGPKHPELEMF